MKSLKEQFKSAIYISAAVFLIGVTVVVFQRAPRLGFFFVSAAAIGTCINVAYSVFGGLMATSLISNIVQARKAKNTPPQP